MLRRFSDFLGQELTEQSLERVVNHCTFKTMKTNTMSNFSLIPQDIMDHKKSPFLRKGNTIDPVLRALMVVFPFGINDQIKTHYCNSKTRICSVFCL